MKMKKLMFATAMAMIGGAFAVDSNVVGYDQNQLRSGSRGSGAAFIPVTGTTINLQEFKPVSENYDPEVGYGDNDVVLQELNPYGKTLHEYVFCDIKEDVDEGIPAMYGWYEQQVIEDEEQWVKVQDVTISAGEGWYAGAPDDSWNLQCAGQVETDGVAVRLRSGSKHIVNPAPVAFNLNDDDSDGKWLIPSSENYDPEVGYGDNDVVLQELNPYGKTLHEYVFCDIKEDVDEGIPAMYGWYEQQVIEDEEQWVKVTGITAPPGQGFYAGAPDDTWYINFPGVVIK